MISEPDFGWSGGDSYCVRPVHTYYRMVGNRGKQYCQEPRVLRSFLHCMASRHRQSDWNTCLIRCTHLLTLAELHSSAQTQVQISIDAEKAFEDVEWALLIGAKPRGPGMERRDLLDLNGAGRPWMAKQ